jgi:hypothetical protein
VNFADCDLALKGRGFKPRHVPEKMNAASAAEAANRPQGRNREGHDSRAINSRNPK